MMEDYSTKVATLMTIKKCVEQKKPGTRKDKI